MLDPVNWYEGDEHCQVGDRVRYSDRLPAAFSARMHQLEAIQRWLAGYFQAAAIMLQLPGGADYQRVEDDEDDAILSVICKADRDTVLSILAACFERLGADEALIHQAPGGRDYARRRLPVAFQLALAEQDDNGLLNVAAECLDRLLVIPHLPEEARRHEPLRDPPRWRRAARRLRRLLAERKGT